MSILHILKNIYTRPLHAFKKDVLEDSFEESVVWYIGLWIISIFVVSTAGRWTVPSGRDLGVAIGGQVLGSMMMVLEAWITALVIKKHGFPLPMEPYLSGVLWIAVAMTPINYIVGYLVPFPMASWIQAAFSVALLACCVHSLSGLSFKSSLRVCAFAFIVSVLVLGVGLAVLTMIFPKAL